MNEIAHPGSLNRLSVTVWAWSLALVAVLAISLCQHAYAAETEAYRVQPGDVLTVSVWREADLQAEVLVRPDGGITFPLAGEHMAAGHTVDELRLALEERLRKFIPDPVVTVTVRQIGGNRIYVLGKVNRPGEFPFSKPVDVMQALSLAGGTTAFASLNDIQILRRENGRQVSISFRYAEVERGKALEQNVLLKSGDTVVVP
jgi:polysaccharide export outer membrane protein